MIWIINLSCHAVTVTVLRTVTVTVLLVTVPAIPRHWPRAGHCHDDTEAGGPGGPGGAGGLVSARARR